MDKKPTRTRKHPPKKTLTVVPSKQHPALFSIAYKEGGNVPKEISGAYNSRKAANTAKEFYEAHKEANKSYLEFVRDKDNAKEKDEAGVQ